MEFKNMIAYELSNYEARITVMATAALDALGLKFDDLTSEQKAVVKRKIIMSKTIKELAKKMS